MRPVARTKVAVTREADHGGAAISARPKQARVTKVMLILVM
jgi:hypothetical protein